MDVRLPNLTLVASFLPYLAARHFDWNLAAFPTGSWYFNPYGSQFLFVLGGWFVLGGSIEAKPLIRSRALLWARQHLLAVCARHDDGGTISRDLHILPSRLYDTFNDKTNLAPYRLVHLIVLAFFINRLVPRHWPGLEWPIFRPLIKCDQQSLEVFCVGVFIAVGATLCLSRFPTRSRCKSQLVSSVSPC
jgi:hypothetical protein